MLSLKTMSLNDSKIISILLQLYILFYQITFLVSSHFIAVIKGILSSISFIYS